MTIQYEKIYLVESDEEYCSFCGIKSFDHIHEKGKEPKEFIILEK